MSNRKFTRKENSSKGVKRKISFATSEDDWAYYKEYNERLEQELEFRKKSKLWRTSIQQNTSGQETSNNSYDVYSQLNIVRRVRIFMSRI